MADRSFTFKNSIKVSSEDLHAAKARRKTCTIRLGIASVDSKTIDLTDGRDRVKVEIVEIDNSLTFGRMTLKEAQGEGFSSVEELEADLKQYYRHLTPDKPVTVIWFRLPADRIS